MPANGNFMKNNKIISLSHSPLHSSRQKKKKSRRWLLTLAAAPAEKPFFFRAKAAFARYVPSQECSSRAAAGVEAPPSSAPPPKQQVLVNRPAHRFSSSPPTFRGHEIAGFQLRRPSSQRRRRKTFNRPGRTQAPVEQVKHAGVARTAECGRHLGAGELLLAGGPVYDQSPVHLWKAKECAVAVPSGRRPWECGGCRSTRSVTYRNA